MILSTLGLKEAHTQENLSASNTNSQYVDVFQDSTGYTNGNKYAYKCLVRICCVLFHHTTTNIDAGISGASLYGAVETIGSANHTGA